MQYKLFLISDSMQLYKLFEKNFPNFEIFSRCQEGIINKRNLDFSDAVLIYYSNGSFKMDSHNLELIKYAESTKNLFYKIKGFLNEEDLLKRLEGIIKNIDFNMIYSPDK